MIIDDVMDRGGAARGLPWGVIRSVEIHAGDTVISWHKPEYRPFPVPAPEPIRPLYRVWQSFDGYWLQTLADRIPRPE